MIIFSLLHPASACNLPRKEGEIENKQVSTPAFGKVTEDSAMFDAKKTWQTLVKGLKQGLSNLLHLANNHQACMKAIALYMRVFLFLH